MTGTDPLEDPLNPLQKDLHASPLDGVQTLSVHPGGSAPRKPNEAPLVRRVGGLELGGATLLTNTSGSARAFQAMHGYDFFLASRFREFALTRRRFRAATKAAPTRRGQAFERSPTHSGPSGVGAGLVPAPPVKISCRDSAHLGRPQGPPLHPWPRSKLRYDESASPVGGGG